MTLYISLNFFFLICFLSVSYLHVYSPGGYSSYSPSFFSFFSFFLFPCFLSFCLPLAMFVYSLSPLVSLFFLKKNHISLIFRYFFSKKTFFLLLLSLFFFFVKSPYFFLKKKTSFFICSSLFCKTVFVPSPLLKKKNFFFRTFSCLFVFSIVLFRTR